jgi:CubicO group peptidase (beta-lactamase class C family)
VEKGIAQALVVLGARRGIVFLHEAFGSLRPDRDSPPVAVDSIFPLASITKAITATAVMQLVEEGRLGLNRAVSDYIPEFTGEGRQTVLINHLLTHTSGLTGEFEPPPPLEQYLFLVYGSPLSWPPGHTMSYCDHNYELLGEIVRRVSGESLGHLARNRIFQPLGMMDTQYCLPDEARPRTVRRPAGAWSAYMDTPTFQATSWGGGGVWSTAWDIAIFGQMFLNGGGYGSQRILSPPAARAMTANQIPGTPARYMDEVLPQGSWGFGWSIHGGKTGACGGIYSPAVFELWGGGGSYMWVDPAHSLVGVYLSVDPRPATEVRFPMPGRCNDLLSDALTAAVVD